MDSPNTILAPSRFQRLHDAILDLNPVAYYPLNELNGSLAYDHANHKFVASAVTSITRSGTTATVTTTAAHGYDTGDLIYISGAVETDYNGSYVITVTAGTTFTYTVGGTPTTPATGTITASKNIKLHGTITGATVGQSGHAGKAYSFDGTGDDVDLGSNAALVAGTGSFSFGQIVNVGTSSNVFSLSSRNGAGGGSAGYDLIVGDGATAGKIRARIADGTTAFQTGQVTVSTNNWHLLVGVINKTDNTIGIYADRNAISTTDISTAGSITNSQNPAIGKRATTIFDNKIQHTFILNRAITANEVLRLASSAELI